MIAIENFQAGSDPKKFRKKENLAENCSLNMHKKRRSYASAQELSNIFLTSEPVAGSEKNRKAVSPASVIR